MILKAYLGWSNEETHGGNSLRLYALDQGRSPRWAPNGGRTVERALSERSTGEGDRYLIVKLGDRFYSEAQVEVAIRLVEEVLESLVP